MTDGFGVDLDRLAHRATEFPELAERAGRLADGLKATLEATGTAWGEDAVGASFAAAHTEAAAEALDLLAGLRAGLTDVGSRFTDAAAEYRAADDSAITGITSAGRSLRGEGGGAA